MSGRWRRRLALGLGVLVGLGVFLVGAVYLSVGGDSYLARCAAAEQQPLGDDRGNWNYVGELSVWPPGTQCTYTRGPSSLELTVPLGALEIAGLVGLAAAAGLAIRRLLLPRGDRRVVVLPASFPVVLGLFVVAVAVLFAFGALPLVLLAAAAAAGVRLR